MDHYNRYKDKIFTIPNALTMLRILLLPVFAYSYLTAASGSDYLIAALILVICSLTDLIDGKVARAFGMISDFGKLLDPVADKLTHLVIALCLCTNYPPMKYVVALIFIKEGCMFLFCLYGHFKGQIWDSAQWYGKVSTAIVFTGFVLLALSPQMPPHMAHTIETVCILFLGFSFVMYAREFISLNKKEKE